jgi:DNA-binding transcriptional LysR family regulator
MHEIHLNDLDLNLLVALDALLTERHVGRAAGRVGLTPSAMSHALGRLRKTLGDDLLVRTRGGMALTPRGELLRGPLQRVLGEIGELVRGPGVFEPGTSRRHFTLATTDYIEVVLLPPLLARISAEAPGVHLRVKPLDRLDVDGLLESSDSDLVVAASFNEVSGLRQQTLFSEEMVFVCRKGHPKVRRRVDLATYLELRHVMISLRGGSQSPVDALLAAQGHRREVALLVPHFLAGLLIASCSDLVLTAPARLVKLLGAGLALQVMPPPLSIPGFTVRQVWHQRHHDDPAHLWLRQQLFVAASGLRKR